jgi:hypothetical protein
MILNSTSVIGAGYSGCFVKSFTMDGSSAPETTAATITSATNTTPATTTTTVAGETTTTTLLPPVTDVTLTTLTVTNLTTLAITNLTTLTTLALNLGRKKRQTSGATVIADVVFSFSAGISNTTLDQAITNATSGNGTSSNITSLDLASRKRLLKDKVAFFLKPGVNFTNVLCAAFTYVSCMRSFFVLTF